MYGPFFLFFLFSARKTITAAEKNFGVFQNRICMDIGFIFVFEGGGVEEGERWGDGDIFILVSQW